MQTYKSPTHVLKVYSDEPHESPRDWDNMAEMIFFGKHKTLGDAHDIKMDEYFSSRQDFMTRGAEILKRKMDAAVVLPVHLYEHSGTGISTSFTYPYNCPWDSGTCGFVVVTKKKIREEYPNYKRITKALVEKATKNAICEVKILNQYISGEVYRFELEDLKGNHEDSCGGYYGDMDENGILDELKSYGPFEEA